MYSAELAALENSATLITANRRLARSLREAWTARQVAGGRTAWETPAVAFIGDWLNQALAGAADPGKLPLRLNAQQSRLLWERCLRKELGDAGPGTAGLVRLSRDAWQRMHGAAVSIRDVARTARSEDQRQFAAAAGRYLAVLEHEGWVDEAGLMALVSDLLGAGRVVAPKQVLFCGFDRATAATQVLVDSLERAGAAVLPPADRSASTAISGQRFADREAEMRAAGAWAREQLEANPDARVAVITQGLELSAARDSRLLRDGFVPGWQWGPASVGDSVNVSYGRDLADYPVIAAAMGVLRWLTGDIPSADVSALLLSSFVGVAETGDRCRLELRLRDLPDRQWKPSMITAELRGTRGTDSDFLERVAGLAKRRRELPAIGAPSQWAIIFDETLREFGWPGTGTLDSKSFQLISRWRELLNEFARIELVAGALSPAAAVARLQQMAGETIFQPESVAGRLELLGPLEAAGAEFDALWIAGLHSDAWPPASSPTPLLARALQQAHGMPDATPEDTLQFANTTLDRLLAAAPTVVCSYAELSDDTERTASELLRSRDIECRANSSHGSWHTASIVANASVVSVADSVPAITGESLHGGSAVIQQQLTSPFDAFAYGRLGVRRLPGQALGISAPLRGKLIHDALYKLYLDLPDRGEIRRWDESELQQRCTVAVDFAFARHERNADDVLLQVLRLERARTAALLKDWVRVDRERDAFEIAAVEGEHEFVNGNVKLSLRFDRVDRFADGTVAIIDYKTGAGRQLVNKDHSIRDMQLFVYAAAINAEVSSLALANVDSRETVLNGAGRGFNDLDAWQEISRRADEAIGQACADLSAGDVSLLSVQRVDQARTLNLLSRFTELRHES